jgi:hypothetical protein
VVFMRSYFPYNSASAKAVQLSTIALRLRVTSKRPGTHHFVELYSG